MDIVMDSPKSELKKKRIEKEGLAWASLLSEVTCLFSSGLGDAIVGLRAVALNSPCNQLPRGYDLMAAPMRSIDALSRKQGHEIAEVARHFSSHHVWQLAGEPFQRCQHEENSPATCWKSVQFVQEIQSHELSFSPSRKQEAGSYFPDGAVVFGRLSRTLCELTIHRHEVPQLQSESIHALTG
jgi:hypothetical protein